jgi:hypothetical protein
MRKYIWIAAILLSAYLITGCEKEEEELYYSALGTLYLVNDSAVFESDNGTLMLVDNYNKLGDALQDLDRVILYFTILEENYPAGFDLLIDVYDIEDVLYKPVMELTEEIADSIGNDELDVTTVWLAKDYLNLYFKYFGGSKKHYINLVRRPGEIPTDTIDLEIRHNDNDDAGSYYYSGFVTFDLTSLQNEASNSVVLRITAREYGNITYREIFTYTY